MKYFNKCADRTARKYSRNPVKSKFKVLEVYLESIWKFIESLAFVPWIAKKAPTSMFDWILNTSTPKVDNEDTRTTSFALFLCFYCWLWTNLVHWFSCIFDIFHKLMFPLFWPSKHHLGKVLKTEKNRWHNTLLKCLSRKSFGVKNVLQITEMIQE